MKATGEVRSAPDVIDAWTLFEPLMVLGQAAALLVRIVVRRLV